MRRILIGVLILAGAGLGLLTGCERDADRSTTTIETRDESPRDDGTRIDIRGGRSGDGFGASVDVDTDKDDGGGKVDVDIDVD